MTGPANARSTKSDLYGRISRNGLLLIARSRNVGIPAGAQREHIVALLRAHDAQTSAPATKKSTPTPSQVPSGWWSSKSVAELRDIARDRGIDVQAGTRRKELIELLIEHDVQKPARQASAGPQE